MLVEIDEKSRRLSWENKSIFNAWFHAWLLLQTTKLLQERK